MWRCRSRASRTSRSRCRWRCDRVLLVIEGDDRGDRAEDLFASDAHVVVHVDQHGRCEVEAGSFWHLAAAGERSSLLAPDGEIVERRRALSIGDHWTDLRRLVERCTDREMFGVLDEASHEVGVRGSLDEDATAGATILTGVREHRHRRVGGRTLDVGVGEHDAGRLPTQLQRHSSDVIRRRLEDRRAGRGLAGEPDLGHPAIRNQRVPHDTTRAGKHAHVLGRHPRIDQRVHRATTR